MPGKNHKALNIRDQSSKRLTLHTYTKWHKRRREKTWGKENGSQSQKNHNLNLRPKTTFQTHKAYTEENTIQIWSSKYGERESHQRRKQRSKVQRDERTKREKKTKWNQLAIEPSSSYEKEHRSQITKIQILKTKTSRDYRRQTNDEENKMKDN